MGVAEQQFQISNAQGEANKEFVIPSVERQSLQVKIGDKPFYVRESDTGKRFFWTGLKFIELTIDLGCLDVNVLRVASNVADTQIVTIGSQIYEFDRSADGAVAGRIAVVGHADDTPDNALTALAATINADSLSEVTAQKISANELLVFSKTPGPKAISCTETLAGANNAWANATTFGGRLAGEKVYSRIRRVPNATEVALGTMHFVFDFTPVLDSVRVVVTATPGIALAWDGAVTISGNRLTIDNTGTVDWAATHTIELTVTD